MATRDDLESRMKALEAAGEGPRLDPAAPVHARLDGRGFSRLTRDLDNPFDRGVTQAMQDTARRLMALSAARAAYVQYDEISLLWLADPERGQEPFFAGRPQKMASVLAGMATAAFGAALRAPGIGLSGFAARLPHFDARVCALPGRATGAEVFSWRGRDAWRNAVNAVAQSVFPRASLHGVGMGEILERLRARGIAMSDFNPRAVHGTLLWRRRMMAPLDEETWCRIPPAHRPPRGRYVERGVIEAFSDLTPNRIDNLEEVLFGAESPVGSPSRKG